MATARAWVAWTTRRSAADCRSNASRLLCRRSDGDQMHTANFGPTLSSFSSLEPVNIHSSPRLGSRGPTRGAEVRGARRSAGDVLYDWQTALCGSSGIAVNVCLLHSVMTLSLKKSGRSSPKSRSPERVCSAWQQSMASEARQQAFR
eukprot:scaffold4623_cov49-Phaeocystis_antarctica.AAC.1